MWLVYGSVEFCQEDERGRGWKRNYRRTSLWIEFERSIGFFIPYSAGRLLNCIILPARALAQVRAISRISRELRTAFTKRL